MSAEAFQLIVNEKIDDPIIKRDFLKIYQQSGADINNGNSNIKCHFDENHYFIQVGNECLEFDIN